MKTFAYVDGFNLYYSALKRTPLRWLNVCSLLSSCFPKNQIVEVKYFTAAVKDRGGSGEQLRQQMYWRALGTLPNLKRIDGHFLTHEVSAKVVKPPPDFVRVFKTEEKGSDVNLASHLLADAFQDRYECAVVVSGDSDLVTPIKMVREISGKPVGILNPQRISGPNCPSLRKSASLKAVAAFYQNGLTWNQLAANQFPVSLTDTNGTFRRPSEWD